MNPINRFLVLFLHCTGFVIVSNLYRKHDVKLGAEEDYSIAASHDGCTLSFRDKGEVAPGHGKYWTQVCNSKGPRRGYQDSFGLDNGGVLGDRPQMGYSVQSENGPALRTVSFRELLLEKQRRLGPRAA